MAQPKIGDRRIDKAIYPYSARGEWHKHVFTLECEITRVDEHNVDFNVVRVIDEAGRPPENAKEAPKVGGCTIENWLSLPTP